MKRKERLMATLRGEPVDRPAVCFYEINGLDELKNADDPYNIYTHPSWRPLIELAAEKSDRILMRGVPFRDAPPDPVEELTTRQTWVDDAGSLFTRTTIKAGKRTLIELTRRDRDVNTVWIIEHLLKDVEDLKAYLDLPLAEFGGTPNTDGVLQAEAELGDTGIVMIDTADPICIAASLFHMQDYTVIAWTETELFRRLLDRIAALLLPRTEAVAQALPGRLWRVVGPEYASPPYLSPALFRQFVVAYDRPMVDSIQRYGGFARIHCHGNIRHILDDIASTGCVGLDPIEPPPQGDVELKYVRERYGLQMVLFGNLEASDIETLPAAEFEVKIRRAIVEGTAGEGRGFVLQPSACPYGRVLSTTALHNYFKMIEVIEGL